MGENGVDGVKPVPLKGTDQAYFHPSHGDVDVKRVHEVKPLLYPLLDRLQPNFKRDVYGVLISDETSGRIPTLLIRDTLNVQKEKLGKRPIPTLFLMGLSSKKEYDPQLKQEFARRISKIQKENPGKRALLVTERISGGWHIGNMSDLLTELGMPHDVAALRMDFDPETIQRNRELDGYPPIAPDGDIFFGKIGDGIGIGGIESDALKGVRHELQKVKHNGKSRTLHRVIPVRGDQTILNNTRSEMKVLSAGYFKRNVFQRVIGKVRGLMRS